MSSSSSSSNLMMQREYMQGYSGVPTKSALFHITSRDMVDTRPRSYSHPVSLWAETSAAGSSSSSSRGWDPLPMSPSEMSPSRNWEDGRNSHGGSGWDDMRGSPPLGGGMSHSQQQLQQQQQQQQAQGGRARSGSARATKLFVGGINPTTSERALSRHFVRYGRLVDCFIAKTPGGEFG